MHRINNQKYNQTSGFTIVELAVAIAIIGILAGITIFSIGNWRTRTSVAQVKNDLAMVATAMENAKNFNNGYPTAIPSGTNTSPDVTLSYASGDSGKYCINAVSKSNPGVTYYIDSTKSTRDPQAGSCAAPPAPPPPPPAPSIAWDTITSGNSHTCALSAGKPYCWGAGTSGQLGNGSTTNSAVPVAVDTSGVLSGKSITSISTRGSHTCVIASGQPYCWGLNSSGQLGNGTTTNSFVPTAVNTGGVLSGKTTTALSVGERHTCVIASGQAFCWGDASSEQLGNGWITSTSVSNTFATPVAVSTDTGLAGKTVTSISAGAIHTCAVASGQPYCWGYGGGGQRGDGTTTANVNKPVTVVTNGALSNKTVTAIMAGSSHSCAIASGQAYCWGWNGVGEIGQGSNAQSLVPVAVDTSTGLAGKTVTSLSTGGSNTCAVAGGEAYCWGANNYGQLGIDSTIDQNVPRKVNTSSGIGSKTVSLVSASNYSACVVASSIGYCFGYNGYGQLGNNTTSDSAKPVKVMDP